MKAAVLGASGIGKFHVREFHNHPSIDDVVFLGSSRESVERTRKDLQVRFGIITKGYYSLDNLLKEEEPDIIVISTPSHTHLDYLERVGKTNVNILCEKPLIQCDDYFERNFEIVEQVVKGRVATHSTQLAAFMPFYLENFYNAKEVPNRFSMIMKTPKKKGKSVTYEEIPHDLVSHPLSILLYAFPNGTVRNLNKKIEQDRTVISFNYDYEGQHVFDKYGDGSGSLLVFFNLEKGNERFTEFGFGNIFVRKEAYEDSKKDYHVILVGEDRTMAGNQGNEAKEVSDPLKTYVDSFVKACLGKGELIVPASAALRNLELQHELLR